jgi:predicted DNA-binding transcriptional regulator AlpA
MAKRQKPSTRPKKPFPPMPPAVAVVRPAPTGPVKLLTKEEVLEILKVSEVTLWDWIRKGHFPQAVVIGPGTGYRSKQGWVADEVYAFVHNSPRRRLKTPGTER